MEEVGTQIWVIGIGTVLSFVSGWLLHLLNDYIKRKSILSKMYTSIISELNNTKKYLDTRKIPMLEIIPDPNDPNEKTVRVHGHSLETSSFDSMLYSGIFRDLDTDNQLKLSEIYGKIKLSNQTSARVYEMLNSDQSVSTRHLNNVQNYSIALDKRYDEIKDEIPNILKLLNNKSKSRNCT